MPSDFLEKTLEDIIFENRHAIHNHGLPKFKNTVFRQLILPSGKKLDIFSYDLIDGHIEIDIYELKRHSINTDAICQAYNYFMEVLQYTSGKFKSIDIHIIMVGRYYDPVMIFEKMGLPFSVYTYDYKLSGMTFLKHQERRQLKTPNDDFCMGLWAFGSNSIYYPNGQPETVNLSSVYSSWKSSNKEAHQELINKSGSIFTEPEIKEIQTTVIRHVMPKEIKTEIFPVQPKWSASFANLIPADEQMFDIEVDDSDYEPDVLEADYSDYEPDITEDNVQRSETPTLEELNNEAAEWVNSIRDPFAVVPLDDPEILKAELFLQNAGKKYA